MDIVLHNENKTNSNTPYKSDIYETYKVWRFLPSFFKNPPKDKKTGSRLSIEDYAEGMGVDDPQVIELMKIRSQTQFSEVFNVSPETLVIWNKKIKEDKSMNELRNWAIDLSKNVLASLYRKAVTKGDALEVKLWFQLVNEWEEKQTLVHKFTPIQTIEIFRDVNEQQPNNQQNQLEVND